MTKLSDYQNRERRAKVYGKDFNKAYSFLLDANYFTGEELHLITMMYGCRMDVLNLACSCRYELDVEQIALDFMCMHDVFI